MSQERVSWGLLVPVLDKKSNEYSNVFKILTAGSSTGVKTGIVCTSLQKPAQETIMTQLGMNSTGTRGTKSENCHNIALQMMRMARITLYPVYKPV